MDRGLTTHERSPRDGIDLFERFFIALYEPVGEERGQTVFFDVTRDPPRNRRPRPEEVIEFTQVIEEIKKTYDRRNNPPFTYVD